LTNSISDLNTHCQAERSRSRSGLEFEFKKREFCFNKELFPLSAAIFCVSLKKRDTKGFPLLSGLGHLFSKETFEIHNPKEEANLAP
jgi:hypothetical protein